MPLAEMQGMAAYIRPKVVRAFPRPCASRRRELRAPGRPFNVSKNKYGPYYTRCHESIIFFLKKDCHESIQTCCLNSNSPIAWTIADNQYTSE
jgi:hypothetical protein